MLYLGFFFFQYIWRESGCGGGAEKLFCCGVDVIVDVNVDVNVDVDVNVRKM